MTRLIFTLSPGRCGTGYLAKMLATIPGIAVRHEGQPDFVDVAHAAQFEPEKAAWFLTEKKLPYVADLDVAVYIETSHMFIGGFAQAMLDLSVPADIITLTRPHREVALSYWQRGSIPGKGRGYHYLLAHDAPATIRRVKDWDSLNDYQRCFWHCLEVEAQSERLAKRYEEEGNRVCRTTFDRITTRDGFLQLLDCLDLPEPGAQYENRREWIVNANPGAYKSRLPDGDLDALEAEVWSAL